ncbi:MAG: site-2 protease family protein, partial [Candidatus Methylomirabilales bacterium]
RLTIERGGGRFEVILTPRTFTQQDAGDQTVTMAAIGIAPKEAFIYNRLNPLTALVEAAKRTAGTIVMILMVLGKVVVGAASPQTVGGPILMAQMTGVQIQQEFLKPFIFLAAHLSIALGMLNLLPLPFLDGGRLCFLVIESIRGRPVSLKTRRATQWVMTLLLMALMILAVYSVFYNEIFQFLKTL